VKASVAATVQRIRLNVTARKGRLTTPMTKMIPSALRLYANLYNFILCKHACMVYSDIVCVY